jgi:hypothetical protein
MRVYVKFHGMAWATGKRSNLFPFSFTSSSTETESAAQTGRTEAPVRRALDMVLQAVSSQFTTISNLFAFAFNKARIAFVQARISSTEAARCRRAMENLREENLVPPIRTVRQPLRRTLTQSHSGTLISARVVVFCAVGS